MKVHMLLSTEQMNSIPPSVKVLQDWGPVSIVIASDIDKQFTGTHVALEGPDEDFKKWILAYDSFWLGQGTPMLQKFELFTREVREEEYCDLHQDNKDKCSCG